MDLVNQASLLALTDNLHMLSFTLSSKYGHFWLQKNQTGFKTVVLKPMDDVTMATSIIYFIIILTTNYYLQIWHEVFTNLELPSRHDFILNKEPTQP